MANDLIKINIKNLNKKKKKKISINFKFTLLFTHSLSEQVKLSLRNASYYSN